VSETTPSNPLISRVRRAMVSKHRAPWLWTGSALLFMLVLSSAVGPVPIPLGTVVKLLAAKIPLIEISVNWPAAFETILFDIRLPHAVLMALTGMALGGSGAAYQGLFRNPLADPYIIGVASGAGLGAVLAMTVQFPSSLLGMAAVPVAAFVGALVTVTLVYTIARVGRTTPVTTLLLAGVAVGTFASALILVAWRFFPGRVAASLGRSSIPVHRNGCVDLAWTSAQRASIR